MSSDVPSTGASEVRSSLLAHFCNIAGYSASKEELADLADQVLADVSTVNEHAPCVGTARAIRSGRASGSTCTLIGTVAGVSHPEVLLWGDNQIEFVTIRLLDRAGEEVPLLPVVEARHAETLLKAGEQGMPVSVSGQVMSVPKANAHRRSGDLRQGTRVGALFISEVEKGYSHLDAMAASEEERELASASIRKAGGNGIKLLCEAVTHRLGLVELERQSQLLKWVAIQSMGCGQIGHTPGTIHLCAIGAPASGKKILSVAAEILNPVSVPVITEVDHPFALKLTTCDFEIEGAERERAQQALCRCVRRNAPRLRLHPARHAPHLQRPGQGRRSPGLGDPQHQRARHGEDAASLFHGARRGAAGGLGQGGELDDQAGREGR